MTRSLQILCLAMIPALAGLHAEEAVQDTVPPPPDNAAGLASTLNQALSDGSNAAVIAFIARYPDDPMTDRARAALAVRRGPDAAPDPGPDGAVFDAFDRARLGGPSAMAGFTAAYANHPLGAEAQRNFWRR